MMHRIDSYDPAKGAWMFVGVYDDGAHTFIVHKDAADRVRKYEGAFGIGDDALLDVQHRGGKVVLLYLDGKLLFVASVEDWLNAPSDNLGNSGLQHFLGPKPKPLDLSRLRAGALTHSKKGDTV